MILLLWCLIFYVEDIVASMNPICKSVGVIGAGAAGLVASEVFSASGLNVRVFEKSKSIGGIWNYASNRGAMYKSLRTNLPKEIMAFPGFPFLDDEIQS